jgi:hypothetical protein
MKDRMVKSWHCLCSHSQDLTEQETQLIAEFSSTVIYASDGSDWLHVLPYYLVSRLHVSV